MIAHKEIFEMESKFSKVAEVLAEKWVRNLEQKQADVDLVDQPAADVETNKKKRLKKWLNERLQLVRTSAGYLK
jgi:flagellar motility protein MotE (MotC chaperone)